MIPPLVTYQQIAADNTWFAIIPEILLGLLALLLLVLELILPARHYNLIPRLAVWGQAAIFGCAIAVSKAGQPMYYTTSFSDLLAHSNRGDAMRVYFLLSSILVCFLGGIYLNRRRLPKVEFFHIVLIITAALMLLVQSNHFIMFFVALETVMVGFYVLVSYCRTSTYSLEAGLKYLILGAASSAILLFGIVLLYGACGNPNLPWSGGDPLNFESLGIFIEANPDNILVVGGMVLVIAGIAFKIGAVPFQIWIPDVYQGAPTPVTAFLAVSSKAAGFIVLLNLVEGPFAALRGVLVPLLSTVAVLTILFGNFSALSQRNVKRMMGLSGIAHTGYMLIGVVASFSVPWAAGAVLFYLFVYLLASFGVFSVMTLVAPDEDALQTLGDYQDLARDNPFLGTVLAVGVGSLAGIPPLAGFIAKLLIFIAAYKAGHPALLAVGAFGVVISIYYYFGWIMAAFFNRYRLPEDEDFDDREYPLPVLSSSQRIVMGTLTAITVALGFYQGAIGFSLL